MNGIQPQVAGGKVPWHFTMSLDGFVAGPNHEMDWMSDTDRPPTRCHRLKELLGRRARRCGGPSVNH